MDEWIRALRHGHSRTLARSISMIEKEHPQKHELLKGVFPYTGKARLIGITGAPGAGKSSLVDGFIRLLRGQGLKVAIVAVDPTSPFTGGALLGDRVRMQEHATDPGVFIRSMGTRGSLGGLSRDTKDVLHLIDAAGFDVILIETVGVGQSELDIMHIADTTMVVLNPGAGDTVQAFKAGIMEIADLFVINKADLPGAEKLQAEVESMLDLAKHGASWRPPIVQTISRTRQGLEEVWATVKKHEKYMQSSGEHAVRKRDQMKLEVLDIVEHQLKRRVVHRIQSEQEEKDWQALLERRKDPYTLAEDWLHALLHNET
jgi:LAO/AO transport system kinase